MATQRKGSLQMIWSFQNNIENHAKDLEFTPATHWLPSGFLCHIPTARLGAPGCAHSSQGLAQPGVGSTTLEITSPPTP